MSEPTQPCKTSKILVALYGLLGVLCLVGLFSFMIIWKLYSGVYRVHIQRIGADTVTILNAPGEDTIQISKESVICLRNKTCSILEDGTIKMN